MKKKVTFEDGMQELESLVQSLESGQMSLEESFEAYERATALRKELEQLLEAGDRRIRVLTMDGERELSEEEGE